MWTVLFGDNEDDAGTAQPTRGPVKTPVSPQHSTPPVTPSPLEPLTPSTPPPQPQPQPRRTNPVPEAKGGEGDDSAMGMLLKRLNNLMIKVGEHEFEKRTLVDQMEKERKLLTAKISGLEKQMEDLKDQNVQLQYKIEYTSEPMLMERVQDVTDMRDALADVKKQLEAELQEKDTELREMKTALAVKDKELSTLREEYEKQIEDLTAEREAAKLEAADAVRVASEAASGKYEEQLKEKDVALQAITQEKETLETSLAEKEQALHEAEAATNEVRRNLEKVQRQGETDAKTLEQLRQELEQAAQEHEQKLQQLKDEGQQKLEALEALEKHAQEQEDIATEKTQELEDYKHDCVELWKINEELKQQIALTSAETMIKHAELRENALSGQTVLQDKVTELENQLEELQEQLNRKSQEVAELQAEAESRTMVDDEASGEDDDKFVVVGGDGGAISILTEQVATAQRELTEAMELNLHLNNRNAWLEEQYQMLSSVQSEGDDEQEDAGVTKPSPEERIAALEQELQEARRAANEKAEHVSNLEQNYSALSTEFDRLHSAHNELVEVKQTDDATLNSLRQELESLRVSQANASDKDQALYAKDQELAELRSSNISMIGDVERLRDVESQLQQVHDALIKAQNDLAEAQAANASLQQELDELRNISAAASKNGEHLTAMQNELNQTRSEKDVVAAKLTQSQASVHDLQLKIQELEGIVNSQINDKKSLEQQLQNLQEMAQENMEGSYELQANLESTMEELEKTRAQLRTEQEKSVALQQSVEEMKQSSISREDLERAQSEIARLEQQVRHFHSLEQSLNQQLQEAVRSKDSIAAELHTARSERVAAEEEHKRLKVSYEQAAAQLSSAQSSTGELQRSNDDLSHSLEQTRAKSMQAEQQMNAMRVEQSEMLKQVETLTKKNLSLVSEIQGMRDEADKQQQVARGQLEQLKAAHGDVQRQLAEATQALQSKDAEAAADAQRSQAQLEDLANRYKADKQSSDQQLAQLNAECEHLRQVQYEAKTTLERSQHELEQIRVQLNATQQEKFSLEAELGQLRGLSDEKAHLLQEADEQKRVNQRLEETNRELEGLLQKSKAYCEELSRDSEDKVSRVEEFARHMEQEARDEIDRIAHENGVLRDELEQLAQARFEETNAHDELRVKLAELQAENNVLSARAHRLTQQLSQYTDLPEDDELAGAGQGQTPDLWELLSSGMEQLKADLELASKYAASIDASSVDGGIGDESFTVAN
ncbi:hypothetical protein PC129_g694 [Phytophthora cactorum]|uniref:Uncharacterized protein n=1 Tax=Phytophthora cactorum TaxID=29920 RepID=A0A329SW28_9STRA|nr:hypothetical protein Pcac1_g2041 [Phytophthora cactorum]KAG2844809.1 hypothetical protein PC112_g2099 [Phytophthora cactorum]KAG2845808.1 hypothetical protein PC111_g1435 [Phytophthora cactorum]KAG2867164.1 hypothetical protein PC113_g2219 [Phytophthora cactorum]KAG2931013.1 hypothetical protein PC114_g2328 [Phytophthora cactorum]